MKSLILMFFVAGIFALKPTPAYAVEYLSYKTKGKLKFSGRVHDFGVVKRGQKLEAEFDFKNLGKGPILIQGVHASCGCTAVDTESGKIYQAGDAGKIRVVFDSTDFVGKIAKVITVMTNEPALPARTLTVKANIISDIEAEPPLADFGDVKIGQMASMVVRLKNLTSSPIAINRIEYNREVVKAGFVEDGNGFVITISLNKNLPTGFIRESVVLHNTSALQRSFVIPVRATISGHIEQEPRYIEFGSLAQGKTVERKVTLKGSTDIEVGNPQVDILVNGKIQQNSNSFLSVDLLEKKNGKRVYALRLKSDKNIKGSVHGRVVFDIGSNEQKKLPIDLYGIFL